MIDVGRLSLKEPGYIGKSRVRISFLSAYFHSVLQTCCTVKIQVQHLCSIKNVLVSCLLKWTMMLSFVGYPAQHSSKMCFNKMVSSDTVRRSS